LATACERAFARHETFHARYGWFRKAVVETAENPGLFVAEDATVTLGVGKNMVRAIRFWSGAAKLIVEAPPSSGARRRSLMLPTANGLAIFGMDGADPFLEAPGTSWLLHWWLLRPPCELPVWWIAFNRLSQVEFTEDDLAAFVIDEITRHGWAMPHESSIRKDLSCLLRTYATADRGSANLDDVLDSPLRGLGLLERSRVTSGSTAGAGYRLLLGAKPSLPVEVIGFATLEWMARTGTARTVSMAAAVFEPGGPGRVFGLSEQALSQALGRLVDTYKFGQLTTIAGATQLAVTANTPLPDIAWMLLVRYYRGMRMTLSRPLGDAPAHENDKAHADTRRRTG
jgi:hypothetical protein